MSGGGNIKTVHPQRPVQREKGLRRPHSLDCLRAGTKPLQIILLQSSEGIFKLILNPLLLSQFQDPEFGTLSGGRVVRIAVNPDYQGVRICHAFLDIHCTEILQLLSSGSNSSEEFSKGHFSLQELSCIYIFFILFWVAQSFMCIPTKAWSKLPMMKFFQGCFWKARSAYSGVRQSGPELLLGYSEKTITAKNAIFKNRETHQQLCEEQ